MERRALESAGAQYSTLRGLIGIPLGIIIVAAALGNLALGPFRHAWVVVTVMVLGVSACGLILRYYRRRYGTVALARRDHLKIGALTVAGAALIWIGEAIDWRADLPICAVAIAFGLTLLGYYAGTIGLKRHHVIVWGALLVAGAAPLWGDVGRDAKINVGLLLMGIGSLVSGCFDHLELKRTFGDG
jgi:hypothetical protein